MVKRSKLEIYVDVLSHIYAGESKPTRIMYAANLSWNQLVNILESLVEQELITIKRNERKHRTRVDKRTKKKYLITKKGINIINYFQKAEQLLTVT